MRTARCCFGGIRFCCARWNFFCKFYHQAPRIQLHFPSWALSVSSWILVLVDWISGAVITSWWLRLGGKKKTKNICLLLKRCPFSSSRWRIHLSASHTSLDLSPALSTFTLSGSWLLCRVRLLVSLTVLVWMQTAPLVAKALLSGSHCVPA